MQYCKDIYNYLCDKHPNKNIYVISDQHFYHANIINYTRNNFSSVEDMNNYIINKHNSIINNDDIVIFLGDYSFKKNVIGELNSKLNGYKYLILGNHDQIKLLGDFNEVGFEDCFSTPVRINNVYLSHEPLINNSENTINLTILANEFKKFGEYNYHGHIHEKTNFSDRYINTCCEVIDYEPIWIGKTKSVKYRNNEFINSKDFYNVLKYIEDKKKINKHILLIDYIYTYLLSITNSNVNNLFCYGSFALLKKYNFLSNISDIDIGYIYDDKLTNDKNEKILKEIINNVYSSLLNINNMDISFRKNMRNIKIINFIYKFLEDKNYGGYYDVNLIPLNIYKDSDFILYSDTTFIEKYLGNMYDLPSFTTKFLNIDGDLATLTLQLLFQNIDSEKEHNILKKTKYIYNNNIDIDTFNNILSRFFIRNIYFLRVTNRKNDIEYIKNNNYMNNNILKKLPATYQNVLYELFYDKNNEFNNVYEEIQKTPFKQLNNTCKQLIKTLK